MFILSSPETCNVYLFGRVVLNFLLEFALVSSDSCPVVDARFRVSVSGFSDGARATSFPSSFTALILLLQTTLYFRYILVMERGNPFGKA